MPTFGERIRYTKNKISSFVNGITADGTDVIPEKGDELVGVYIGSLWEDGKNYYENAFADSKSIRLLQRNPQEFIKACKELENGNDWEVWGHRNANDGEQELTDGLIGDQIRTRNSFLNGNWHDVIIAPNIKGINEIFDQERKATDWGKNMRKATKSMQMFGGVWLESCLDRTENPEGLARENVLRPLSFYLTPEARSIDKRDGNWYAVHSEQVNGQYVKETYPRINLQVLASTAQTARPSFIGSQTLKNYTHTRMYNKIRCYFDDPTLEEIPFSQEEFDIRIADIIQGADVQPTKDDNHKKYITSYIDFLEEREKFYNGLIEQKQDTSVDTENLAMLFDVIEEQIALHQQAQEDAQKNVPEEERIPAGKRKKYPFGRYVVTINDEVAEDKPNPYQFEWRRLFHYIANEEVPERVDGRGDVEILMPTAKISDTMLSRFADMGLQATPKPWFHETERKNFIKDGYNNNPLKPGFYTDRAPVYPSPNNTAANSFLQAYQINQGSSVRKLGVNDITYGDAPSSVTSGDQADTLLDQNSVVIKGEANQNISDAVEDMVETRLMIWKTFYTNPRPYFIGGKIEMITLSEHLMMVETGTDGQATYKEIPAIQVTVRPDSNFPYRWESQMATLTKFADMTYPDETPLIPKQIFLDMLAEKFPVLKNQEYQLQSQAMQIGMQVMQQQQAQAQEKQDVLAHAEAQAQKKLSTNLAQEAV